MVLQLRPSGLRLVVNRQRHIATEASVGGRADALVQPLLKIFLDPSLNSTYQ
jgi:hypothetical protein